MKKLLAIVAVATVAMSAMAFTVSAQGTEDETAAPIVTEEPAATEATEATEAAPNPTTGNAPIALAAIPAAIAAAAIVAKKAK